MSIQIHPVAIGVCAQPLVFTFLAANAPWFVTTITGILAGIWYARQLYKDFKKDHEHKD